MTRKARVALAVAVTFALAGAVAVFALSRDPDSAATGVQNTRSPEEVSSYWTEERMREASPG